MDICQPNYKFERGSMVTKKFHAIFTFTSYIFILKKTIDWTLLNTPGVNSKTIN